MPQKLTKEEFIERSNKIHNNKYDYSKVDYINQNTEVTIICPIHGEFKQKPKYHLQGNGCKYCYNDKRGKTLKKTTEQFINEARKVHGDKYDYSETEYNGAESNVTIICPIHGKFSVCARNHIRQKQGCKLCSNERKGKWRLKSQETFLREMEEMYGDKYDFSNVKYINNHSWIVVTCKEHGPFRTKPNWLLSGHTCKECGKRLKKSETIVLNRLKEIFENVEHEKNFEFLKSKTSYQKIDFYLPDYNVGIEYQGRQHFTPLIIFGGEKQFLKNKERDIRKYNKCKENGIKLYYLTFEKEKYIPDDYFAKVYTNIDELIKDIIQNHETITK